MTQNGQANPVSKLFGDVANAVARSAGRPSAFILAVAVIVIWAGLDSTYGAAASLVVILIWVYYSSQIVLIGAEFTHVYAERRGSRRGQAR